jgi:hypothetical protein
MSQPSLIDFGGKVTAGGNTENRILLGTVTGGSGGTLGIYWGSGAPTVSAGQ